MITIGNAWDKRQKEIAEINRKARVEREIVALQEAAKIAGAYTAMNSFMFKVGLMNMGPSIYGNLKDSKVISELTKNGSSILDWAKMESIYSCETSMGKDKVHYYRNLKTGEISFYDLKMKVPIPKDLKIREGLTDDFWIIDLDHNFKPKGIR